MRHGGAKQALPSEGRKEPLLEKKTQFCSSLHLRSLKQRLVVQVWGLELPPSPAGDGHLSGSSGRGEVLSPAGLGQGCSVGMLWDCVAS